MSEQPSLLQLEARIHELEAELKGAPANEAGFSLNWQMQDKDGANVNVTLRCGPAEVWPHIMGLRADFMQKALAAGWKPAGQVPTAPQGPQAASNGHDAPYYWLMDNGALALRKGKKVLVLKTGYPEPQEVACPEHSGAKLKRRTNDQGAWLSHKQGDGYCSAVFETA